MSRKVLATKRRGGWFWVGVILLSFSALVWLIVIVGSAASPGDTGYGVLAGVFITAVPVIIGLYNVGVLRKVAVWYGARRSAMPQTSMRARTVSRLRNRGGWFWLGVALLSFSALFWLIIIAGVVADPGDAGLIVGGGIIITAIPMAVGMYTVGLARSAAVRLSPVANNAVGLFGSIAAWLRGRLVRIVGGTAGWLGGRLLWIVGGIAGWLGARLAVDRSMEMPQLRETSTSIVYPQSPPAFRWLFGGLFLIPGLAFIWVALTFAIGFLAVAALSLGIGILLLGWPTSITFDERAGCVKVSRGHVLMLLWFMRWKRISREEARSAFVGSATYAIPSPGPYGGTPRQEFSTAAVKVRRRSGELTLCIGDSEPVAAIAERIKKFGEAR